MWLCLEHYTNFRITTLGSAAHEEPVPVWIPISLMLVLVIMTLRRMMKHRSIIENGQFVLATILTKQPAKEGICEASVTYSFLGQDRTGKITIGDKFAEGDTVYVIANKQKPEQVLFNLECAALTKSKR